MLEKEATNVPSTSTPRSSGPLHIERPNNEFILQLPPKDVLWKSSYNLNTRAAQHYSIVEDLSQAPEAMSTLEVLQTCPTQQKSLLSAIGPIDHVDSSLITFDLENCVPRLPHQIAFLIQFIIKGKMIHWIFIDEGASTCIMFVSCWKSIGSQPLNQPPNTLEAFDGKGSCPILTNFPITLEGKTIELEVEVVDANLNYNLLIG